MADQKELSDTLRTFARQASEQARAAVERGDVASAASLRAVSGSAWTLIAQLRKDSEIPGRDSRKG